MSERSRSEESEAGEPAEQPVVEAEAAETATVAGQAPAPLLGREEQERVRRRLQAKYH